MPIGYTSTTTSSPTGNTSGGGSWIPGAVGGLFSSWINARQQKKERQHRTKAEEAARKYNLEQWHRQNLYNHPLEQMQRLRDAGLNPNLIYGSSPGSAVGNAGAVAPGKAPELNYRDFFSPGLQSFQNVRLNQAQTNNLKADVMLKGTQSMKNAVEAGMTGRKLDQFNAMFDDVVGQTASNAAIASIKAQIANKTKYQHIMQTFTKTDSDLVALKLKEIDLDYANIGYPKGLYIPQIGTALGFDMGTPEGREGFKVASQIAAGSRIFQMLTPAFRAILKGLKLK